jgi:hypothetical protein
VKSVWLEGNRECVHIRHSRQDDDRFTPDREVVPSADQPLLRRPQCGSTRRKLVEHGRRDHVIDFGRLQLPSSSISCLTTRTLIGTSPRLAATGLIASPARTAETPCRTRAPPACALPVVQEVDRVL